MSRGSSGLNGGTTKRKSSENLAVSYYGPLLDALRALGGSGTPDEVIERIARDQHIPDAVQNEQTPSGEPRFRKNVHWARFSLAREGLLDSSRRGVWSLTEQGRKTSLTSAQAHELFLKWVRIDQDQRRSKIDTPTLMEDPTTESLGSISPELPADGYRERIVRLLLSLPPSGFERFSQRLLREAGFADVVVTGGSGDEGIDGHGTLRINPLVSFKVLFQCKRYSKSVSPSHVRDFRGAMAGRADKGIIITTGSFTAKAKREASRDGVPPIELIDADKLVGMLEQLELGLKPLTTFEIDAKFFDEFTGS